MLLLNIEDLKNNMEVFYVNHGIGNNFGNYIEINKHLKDYPKLHESVLNHELKHTNSFFSWRDFKIDVTESQTNSWDLLKFMVRHPLSFTQLLPVYITKKQGIVYDLNLIFIYLFVGMFLGVTFIVIR